MNVLKGPFRCPWCGEMAVELFVGDELLGLFCSECGARVGIVEGSQETTPSVI
jgi:translation initiation factor 2 beta subunit (eIF-2beta)/eIF-5